MAKKKLEQDYTSEFELFWRNFPSRWNKDFQGGSWIKRKKRPAFEAWRKLSEEIRAKCLRVVKQIKKSEGGSVRDAVTWINQIGWDDIEENTGPIRHLPQAMTNGVKTVESTEVNANNERNRQMRALLREK